jgi:hypothetical protein
MPSADTRTAAPQPATSAPATSLEQTIRAHLERRRLALADEIRAYPSPIAGCDQQFNWLLEQRNEIAANLRRLEEVCARHPPGEARDAALGKGWERLDATR